MVAIWIKMASKIMSAERLSERLSEQKKIVEKAVAGKMLNKYEGLMITGENSDILRGVSGELRNTHLAVFKGCLGRKRCEHCGIECKIERAHTKDRPSIALEVLDEIHPDPNVPIALKAFMTAYVLKHAVYGVWMLCKKCHKELG